MSYAEGSSQLTIDWEWNQSTIYFLMDVSFYNPYNGNLIQSFDWVTNPPIFTVPAGLDKIRMNVAYNGTLSTPFYQV